MLLLLAAGFFSGRAYAQSGDAGKFIVVLDPGHGGKDPGTLGTRRTRIYEKHVDVIFMDPPYDQEQERRVLEQLRYAKYVSEETLILVEASLHTDFSYAEDLGFEVIREKKYKTNKHVFLRKK